MPNIRKVVVVGFDGLEPKLVERLIERGELPNMARLRQQGNFARLATTCPAQTPVAWSTFATGVNPGGHGIFDFIQRDPRTYMPQLALNRYQQTNPFLPPKAVNLRRGKTVWDALADHGLPSVVLRCPCTYPAGDVRGRLLSGMGVPDLRGGLGTSTFYTTAEGIKPREGEAVVRVVPDQHGNIATHLLGPLNGKTRRPAEFEIHVQAGQTPDRVVVRSTGEPRELELVEGRWSEWLKVKFKPGLLQSARGMVRFYLVRGKPLELYASPLNFDPQAPIFPISFPAEYAAELESRLGAYYTAGMIEDHAGLSNGRITEEAFLDQCGQVWRQREAMLFDELARLDEGLLFCLFDTPDRVQHMFWRFTEPDHPANQSAGLRAGFEGVIDEQYRRCDTLAGQVLDQADENTLVIAMSDHGFNSFRRGMHLNTWLHDQGLLAMKPNMRPGDEAGDFFHHVDWSRTKAYALGLGGVYLNLAGREAQGTVSADEAQPLKSQLARTLSGLVDPQTSRVAVRSALAREEVYRGPYTAEAPDLVVNFAEGYRCSWATTLGGVPQGHFEDNTRRWAGDHIIDPLLVPGVLLMNRPFRTKARLTDLAPTILAALGAPIPHAMEGEPLV